METQMIQGSPCPLCGEVAFALESLFPTPEMSDYAFLWGDDLADPYLRPCECTGCGNVQLVVTRSSQAAAWTLEDEQEFFTAT